MDHYRYELIEHIGQGSMGSVHRALDRLTDKQVAIKQITSDYHLLEFNPQLADVSHQARVLANEFRLLAALRHPNIVTVLDYGFTPRRKPFLVMELIENADMLHKAVKNRDLSGKIDILLQILQALAYLHRHHIIHRDLKPGNIMVEADGLVKVLDFGIAVRQGEAHELMGTIQYVAPEVLKGAPVSVASDLFSVGVIAYEILTGTVPFGSGSMREIASRLLDSEPDWSPFDDPALKPLLAPITCLLSKKAENRYPDAISALRGVCEALGEVLPPEQRESFLQAAQFVGREKELETLEDALMKTYADHGSLWLIGGESGAGKSRLLDELRVRALVEGVIVIHGQAVENGSAEDLWRGILRPLTFKYASARRAFDDLNHDTLAEAFASITDPVLVVIEDIHSTNLDPLRVLTPLLAHLPVLMVASYRTDELPDLELPGAQHLKLGRLSKKDIGKLTGAILGDTREDVLDFLAKETEGNAFFIVEVIRALAENAGQLDDINHSTLPEMISTSGIQHFVQRRLQKVPPWAYEILQLAALMGRKIDPRVLNKILAPILALMTGADLSVTVSTIWREKRGVTLDDWLLLCADASILEAQENEWFFAHDKLREQILMDLNPNLAQMLRNQINKARTAIYGT